MKTTNSFIIRLFLLVVPFLMSSCLLLFVPKERDCTALFEYEYTMPGSTPFNGLNASFDFANVPVTEKILSSDCVSVKEGTVENVYETVRFTRNASGRHELRLVGPDNIGNRDNATLYVDNNGTVYKDSRPAGPGLSDEVMGQLTFDIPNRKMKYSGTRKLTEKLGDD
jgi:hypothetical protein